MGGLEPSSLIEVYAYGFSWVASAKEANTGNWPIAIIFTTVAIKVLLNSRNAEPHIRNAAAETMISNHH